MTAPGADARAGEAPWAADRWERLPHAHGGPSGQGRLRVRPEDFRVSEELAFEPDGAGEHVLLLVRKVGANTRHVAGQLARRAQVAPVDVGYAGLKDRHAIAEQWFSLRLPGRGEPDWGEWSTPEWQVCRAARHSRKLRRGALRGNRFSIRVRELIDAAGALEHRLRLIGKRGVPNYFGPQRFGRHEANLARAWNWLASGDGERPRREARGFALSAARSLLFNAVAAQRVAAGDWDTLGAGDVAGLDGTRSVFAVTHASAELEARAAVLDVHPTGPLWGAGELPTRGQPAEMERAAADRYRPVAEGLEKAGLKQERRHLRQAVRDLHWRFGAGELELRFCLGPGGYATSVLRELIDTESFVRNVS